jgi:hypothetical protein
VLGPPDNFRAVDVGVNWACMEASLGNQGAGIEMRDGTCVVLGSCEASRLRLVALLLFVVVVLVLLALFTFSSFGLLEFSFSAIIHS